MTPGHLIAAVLLGLAVVLCFACALGVLVVRDPYQRLHFPATVVSLASGAILVAVFLDDADIAMRAKTALVAVVLFFMNGVLGHLTARAHFVREKGRWRIDPGDGADFPEGPPP